ncbi:hypothetical protein CRUP_000158 [Coryphaenoides rupestris]|nr:hypothetical protein CRUP_000158 [Coryphaenoides rupestris]
MGNARKKGSQHRMNIPTTTPSDDTVCPITEEPFYALFSSLGSFYIPLAVILAMYCQVYVVAKRTTRNLEAGVMKENSNEVTLRIHCRNQQIQDLCVGKNGGGGGGGGAAGGGGRTSNLTVKLLKFSREKKAAKTLGVNRCSETTPKGPQEKNNGGGDMNLAGMAYKSPRRRHVLICI